MSELAKWDDDLSRLRAISRSLEAAFFEALENEGLHFDNLGAPTMQQGDRFEPGADMVTMMDFSGEVAGFAAVAVDATEMRKMVRGEPEWELGDLTEDMIKEMVNQAAQDALNLVRTENGVLSCLAPRTIYGQISIPKIPCVTRFYRDSPLKLSFSMALDRMESDLMRINRRLIERERTLRSEVERRRVAEQRLEYLASTDVLTGSTTRRKFLEVSQNYFERSRKEGEALSVILTDIDRFKSVNDTYGHAAGDTVLRTFGQYLRDSVRKTDFVGRLGGEEFGICLPHTDHARAMILAERIRANLAEQLITLPDGRTVKCTASLGVAQLSEADENIEALLHRADLAMYSCKRNGRNQVALAA